MGVELKWRLMWDEVRLRFVRDLVSGSINSCNSPLHHSAMPQKVPLSQAERQEVDG